MQILLFTLHNTTPLLNSDCRPARNNKKQKKFLNRVSAQLGT